MDKNAKTTGTAVCPRGELLNHDGDELRASQLSDGRVSCVICGGVCNPVPSGKLADQVRQLPALAKAVVADLIIVPTRDEEAFKVAGVTVGSGEGAVAQGFGPEDVGTTICLTLGQYADVKVEISYTGHDIKSAENGEEIGSAYDRRNISGIVPFGVDKAAQKLAALGFRLVNVNMNGMLRHLTLVKGRKIPGKDTVIGVRAQVSWIVN